MKRLFPIFFTCLLFSAIPTIAEESNVTDEWNDIGKAQDAWDGQKIITDDQFDKIIEQRTKKQKEKDEKWFKKKVGEALIPETQSETNITSLRKMAEDYPTLLVPKALSFGETLIPTGFYRILAAKNKNGKFFINFYQGNKLVGKIPAKETNNDYEAETINYAKIIYTESEQRAKIVYGCLEYNLVAETYTK